MTIATPDWVKHAVFYQIFPDSFARMVPQHQQWLLDVPLQAWDAPPNVQEYKGGNLWGIISQLDYLQDLGFTALYLTPVFQSACNHRYHTHDYYQVDPLLGGNEALWSLRDELHRRGMRLVLDGVFNHASRGFFQFNDILEQGPHSPWIHWFEVENWPLSAYDGSLPAHYKSWVDNRALPQFNHRNPAVREYLMRVGEYWISQGMDGWRLDVPFCITEPGFWQEFRQRIKAVNPEAYITGEIFGDASPWLDGHQFDGVMNYPFGEATLAFVGGDRVQLQHLPQDGFRPTPPLDAAGYGHAIQTLLHRHPWTIQQTQLNLLDSHDVARVGSILGGDRPSLILALILLMTFPGAPCVFYGDEVGLMGVHEPDCRRGFPTPDQWDRSLQSAYHTLIQVRHRLEALRTGTYEVLLTDGLVYGFGRSLGDRGAIVVINGDTEAQSFRIDLSPLADIAPGAWSGGAIAYGDENISGWDLQDSQIAGTLAARSGLIYATP